MQIQEQINQEVEDYQDLWAVQLFQKPKREFVDRLQRIMELSDIARRNNSIPKAAVLKNIRQIANGISH